MSKKDELIQVQKEYIELLSNALGESAVFLFTHGIKADANDVAKGKELREKIKNLELEIE